MGYDIGFHVMPLQLTSLVHLQVPGKFSKTQAVRKNADTFIFLFMYFTEVGNAGFVLAWSVQKACLEGMPGRKDENHDTLLKNIFSFMIFKVY